MNIEGVLNRLEKQQEDIQADVTDTVMILEAADEKLNNTHRALHQHLQVSLR